MKLTRINAAELRAAVEAAVRKIDEAETILKPYVTTLTDRERTTIARAREGFPSAGRAFARALTEQRDICECVGCDPVAVVEDLDNVEALAGVDEKLSAIQQSVADTRLVWTAEAYVPSLAAYAVAKVRAKTDGRMKSIVEPLAETFSTRRERQKVAPSAGTPPATPR